MFPIRDTQPSYSKPLVNYVIIAVNLAVFFFEFALGPYAEERFIFRYGLIPDRFQFSNVLTSMFLHGGWLHVLGNMWFLWIFGDNIEDTLGHAKYILFYLACGIAAAFTQVFLNPYSRVPMVGASGAIAGVMGAYMIRYPQSRIKSLLVIVFFITFVDVPAWIMLIYWFAIQFFSGFESLVGAQGAQVQGGTAFFAHVGGFIAGIILISLMAGRKPQYRRPPQRWDY